MRLTAPGKLFLTGEYAVLWGAPATVAAVEPRLGAQVRARDDQALSLRVPGGALRGELGPAGVRWRGECPAARFAARALELGLAARGPGPGLSVRFERGARGERGQKLGLGSSAAAAAVAALAGLWREGQPVDPDRVFLAAARAHWEVQGRKGSNGDVAAACYGGLIRYARYPLEAASPPPRPEVQRLEPAGLRLALVFSGSSAKTPSMVSAVEAALSPAERQAFVDRSAEATAAFAAALTAGARADALAALNRAGDLLEELGKRAGVEVVTPALAAIQTLGREAGLAAKVSGAGGGDGALFAGFDPAALEAALAAARARGYLTLALPLAEGVRAEPAEGAQPPASSLSTRAT